MDRVFSLKNIIVISGLLAFVGCQAGSPASLNKREQHGTKTQKVQNQNYNAAKVNIDLGIGYLEQGNVSRAKKKFLHAKDLAPSHASTRAALAYFYETVGDLAEAEKEYKLALKYSEVDTKGAMHNNLGAFLCRQSRYEEADKEFQAAISDKTYIRTAEVYENAGLCALKWAEKEKAEAYFKTSVRRDHRRAQAWLALSELSFSKEDFRQSQEYLKQYRRVADNTSGSLWLGIQLADALNDTDGLASQALILKNLFTDSAEYKLYKQKYLNENT